MADEEKKEAEETKAPADGSKPKAHRHKAKHAGKTKKKDGSLATKIVATVFGAVVAPILVAVGIKWATTKVVDSPPAKDKHAAATTEPQKSDKVAPGTIDLLTPDLAEHFYTFNWNPELEQDERRDKIDPALFHYVEKPARIVVPAGARPALLVTKEEFEDYTLHFWYRWGEKQFGSGAGRPRRASVLVHSTGLDGGFSGIFPECIAVHIGEGDTGSVRLMGHPRSITCVSQVKESPDRLRREYVGGDAKGIAQVSGEPPDWRRVILRRGFPADLDRDANGWIVSTAAASKNPPEFLAAHTWSLLAQTLLRQPQAAGPAEYLLGVADVVTPAGLGPGWHPPGDLTFVPPYLPGQWNKVVIACAKGRLTVSVNRTLVNEFTDLNLKKGKIGFSSQGSEYEIRTFKVEVHPPDKPAEKGRP